MQPAAFFSLQDVLYQHAKRTVELKTMLCLLRCEMSNKLQFSKLSEAIFDRTRYIF